MDFGYKNKVVVVTGATQGMGRKMDFGYKNKVVVVTGAAQGMGRATANFLVQLGAKVYALDWAEVAIEGIRRFVRVDLSQKESIDQAFLNLPEKIDCFFGIAGVSGLTTDFKTTFAIDFLANKYISETYLVHRMSKGGSVTFATSTAGIDWQKEENKRIYRPFVETSRWEECIQLIEQSIWNVLPGTLAYPFAKLAMNYYVSVLQARLTSKGVRVNAILPGTTDTAIKDQFAENSGGEAELLKYTGYANRFAMPEEMAQTMIFLNSDLASYVSGELMVVDYGASLENQAGLKNEIPPIDLSAILQQIMEHQS